MSKTNTAITQNRTLKQAQTLTVLLIAVALVASFFSPFAAAATSTTTETTIVLDTDSAPVIDGTFQVVSNGFNTDPHVSCNLASYTADPFLANSRVHYQDLSTGTDNVIPGDEYAFASGVSGSRIAYTVSTSGKYAIRIFDTSSQTTTAVPGVNRVDPSIGGNLVAFEDYSNSGAAPQIITYDLSTGIVTPLTSDSLMNRSPKVSPNGNAVVWEKCTTNNDGCDVYAAIRTAPGVFTTRALTTGGGEDRFPSTDGEVVVYTSDRTGERDVYYQPLDGSSEVHLSILGDQRRATVSRHLIAFESGYLLNSDIYVYDIRTGNLSKATSPLQNEIFSEISVCNGVGRIVYVVPEDESGSFDVHAFSFAAPHHAEDQIEDLNALIVSFNLPKGTANSLINKLQQALDAIEASDTATACSLLTDFTNQCAAQSGKKITADQATQLINSADLIKSSLGCQLTQIQLSLNMKET